MPSNALNLMNGKCHVAQMIIIEDIDNIIKGACVRSFLKCIILAFDSGYSTSQNVMDKRHWKLCSVTN